MPQALAPNSGTNIPLQRSPATYNQVIILEVDVDAFTFARQTPRSCRHRWCRKLCEFIYPRFVILPKRQIERTCPGLMNAEVGGYHVSDIEISSAFDVNANKVHQDVADAIWAKPNNTHRFSEVPRTGVVVHRGPVLDGISHYLEDDIPIADVPEVDVTNVLEKSRTDVVVSYLPVRVRKGCRLVRRARH